MTYRRSSLRRAFFSNAWPHCAQRLRFAVLLLVACSGKEVRPEEPEGARASQEVSLDAEDALNNACVLGDCEEVTARISPLPRPVCPLDEPQLGAACDAGGLTCTYGESASAYCRREYVCEDQSWVVCEHRRLSCLSQPEGFCPTEPENGATCTAGESDLLFVPCEYAGGITCHCIGNPVGVAGVQGEWECYGPPRNGSCPELLPNIGEGCANTGQYCSYGIVEQGCYAPYANVYCYQGAWEEAETSCSL
jgi:hypothetical protein